MSSKSKIKGASFERDIAMYLSKLYSDSFTRAAHSGAFVGGKNAIRKETLSEAQIKSYKGDIVPPDHWTRFNAECKNYASFPFHRLLFAEPVPLLEEWLSQLMDVADENDVNILFIKITRIGKFIATEKQQGFKSTRHLEYTDKKQQTWIITEFNDFFDQNSVPFEKANIG